MKQRNAMIAVWTALLIAIGVALVLATMPEASENYFRMSPPPEPTAGSVQVTLWPEAAQVRLFVEDLSFREQERTGEWTSRPRGTLLTEGQRAIVDKSVHFYRMTKREAENRTIAGCFMPHHFFRYYDKTGRQIGELQICYCCQGIAVEPALRPVSIDEEWQFDFPKVEKMLHEMGVRTDINCDD